jgi:hypothetical protein
MNHTPDMMPSYGSKGAPSKFKGSYEEVKKFLKKFNQMCKAYNVPKDQDKCEHILDYCSSKVVKLIEALPSYKEKDWIRLETDILSYYDAELRETRYKVHNIQSLTQHWRHKRIKDLTQWEKYFREFMTIAGWLLNKKKINETQQAAYFWHGIHSGLRGIIEQRLSAKNPLHDITQVFPMTDVINTAQALLERNRFDYDLMDSDSEESSDESSESDSEDNSSENSESESESEVDNNKSSYKKKSHKMKAKSYKTKSSKEEQWIVTPRPD